MSVPSAHQPVEVSYSEGGAMMKFHSHPYFELYYFHGGKANYLIGDKIFVLSPGDLILMHGMTLHCPNVDANGPYRRSIVHFDPVYVKALADKLLAVPVLKPFYELKNVRIHLDGPNRDEIETLLERMRRFTGEEGKLSQDRLLVTFLDLLLHVYGLCEKNAETPPVFPSDKERHAQNIIDYVEEHYQEDLNMNRLEERLHLNKYYLSKLFREVTGVTIFNYLYHRRINQAMIHFLLDRELSVTEVCYKVGFKHPSHFTRLFKSRVGCTPEQYRRQGGLERAGKRGAGL